MIERRIKQVYEQQEVEISSVEIETLANISCEQSAVDIMEVYSPARFSKQASRFGLKPGFAIDLEEAKPDGSFWDLSRPEDVEAVNQLIDRDKPVLLTGSPPCDQFSHLQNINKYRVSPDQRKIRMDKALEHLRNSCSFDRKQLDAGRLFLHEAPWSATSWKDPGTDGSPGHLFGPRADVPMGDDGDRPLWSSRHRLCEKGDRLAH